MTAADLALEMLADRELELVERVASLESDIRTYRELAMAGFRALHDVTVQHRALVDEHEQLKDQLRFIAEEQWLRASVDDLAPEPSRV